VQQERLLIVYGVLLAVEQLHAAGIVHGDIKSSNVLLTSTNLAFLSDITPWKPVHLPTDNTAQLSNFFETDIDVRCSVAPERFYDAAAGGELSKRPALLLPSMDIFSLGCLIFELLTDKPLFGLPELRQHSEGTFKLIKPKPFSVVIVRRQVQPGGSAHAPLAAARGQHSEEVRCPQPRTPPQHLGDSGALSLSCAAGC